MSEEKALERLKEKPRLEVGACPHTAQIKVHPGWEWCPDCWLLQGPPNEKAHYKIVLHRGILDDIHEMSEKEQASFFEVAAKIAVDPKSGATKVEEI